jgi:hypothetical protein
MCSESQPAAAGWLLTYGSGADVLAVISLDGTGPMWTSTRDGYQPAQLDIADFIPPKGD